MQQQEIKRLQENLGTIRKIAGWTTQENGAVVYAAADIDKAAIGTTLYAVWKEAVDNNENIENAGI